MMDNLPVLVVILPLLATPLVLLLGGFGRAWAIATVACWVTLAATAALLQRVSVEGPVSYRLGNWAPPWGIEYRIDLMGAYVLLIVVAIAALVLVFARQSVEKEITAERRVPFFAAYLLVVAGLAGITVTGDAFNLFVFLEISSLASYALISLGRDRRALTAAFQYLVMGTIGATFFIIGVGFLYMMTGTLNMMDLAERLPEVADTRMVRAAFAFIVVGLGLKLALFPLHMWMPDAYAYSPSVVSALLAATASKVAVYALLRFLFTIFGLEFALGDVPLDLLLMALGLIGILFASLVAVFQENVKRMLAYSSVAQIGYIVLGISLANTTGVTASILHLFNHALMKGALFLALGAVVYRIGSARIQDFHGLGYKMPWTMAGFVIGGLSLIGVPPTAGFISKWFLVTATLEQNLWPVAVVVLVGSILALIYVWRVVEAAYFIKPASQGIDQAGDVSEAPLSLVLPVWVLAAANIWFGIHTDLSLGIATRASAALLGGAP
ncbi:MAG: monovalent cation/H+ antiporter subunit D family protein [Magnetococcales bacterium]|nr:monovalent cation/H+ antiporter subunit D family protein [Magnetococcales bacterium]